FLRYERRILIQKQFNHTTMRYFLIVASITFLFTACSEKDLEITPTDKLSDATVWTDANSAGLFLNDIYNSLNPGPYPTTFTNLPSEISNDPLDNYTDNTTYGPNAGPASAVLFDNCSYGPSNTLFDAQWKNMYANIRKCNLFI